MCSLNECVFVSARSEKWEKRRRRRRRKTMSISCNEVNIVVVVYSSNCAESDRYIMISAWYRDDNACNDDLQLAYTQCNMQSENKLSLNPIKVSCHLKSINYGGWLPLLSYNLNRYNHSRSTQGGFFKFVLTTCSNVPYLFEVLFSFILEYYIISFTKLISFFGCVF